MLPGLSTRMGQTLQARTACAYNPFPLRSRLGAKLLEQTSCFSLPTFLSYPDGLVPSIRSGSVGQHQFGCTGTSRLNRLT